MLDMPAEWLNQLLLAISSASIWPENSFFTQVLNLRGLLATILVCFVCGAVGSLVVGNRMAFFSDALAHCAFAGVALGMIVTLAVGARRHEDWLLPVVMVAFGVFIGVAIAFVREKTGLASDTVIGVFFAGAVGFGGMLLQRNRNLNPESFLFGSPLFVTQAGLTGLGVLPVLLGLVQRRRCNLCVLAYT